MDFGLTREQEILRDTAREFAQRELAPKALALDKAIVSAETVLSPYTKMAEPAV